MKTLLPIPTLLACALWAQAQGTLQFHATLTGSQVVPPNSDPTVALGDFWLTGHVLNFSSCRPANHIQHHERVRFTARPCRARKRPSFLIWVVLRSLQRQLARRPAGFLFGSRFDGHVRRRAFHADNRANQPTARRDSGTLKLPRSRCRTASYAAKFFLCLSLRHGHCSGQERFCFGGMDDGKNKRANKITGANSRPASQFESRGLRRCALVFESQRRYHGGAAVAQFCR